jgi:WD40 repeat protein
LAPPPSGRIGRYRIERRLGSGGMGVVYLGHDDRAGTLAAVKLIRPEYATDPRLRARLRREVAAAQRVPRFCTAAVLDFDVDTDPPWVATEYIDGPTLDTALLEHGRLTGPALATFAVGVAVALRAIHQQGVVHRDLKPSNILLSTIGPRVIDFGIARLDGADTPLTRTGSVVGTPAYMAPEQLRGDPVTAAVDVFAWAGVVTFAATGRAPFAGDLPLHAIVHDPPDLGDLAGPLRELVAAALAKDPAARPSTSDLVARLSLAVPAATTQVLATATTAPPPPSRPRRRTLRRRLAVAAAVVTALAVGLAGGAVALARGDDPPPAAPEQTRSRELAAESLAATGTDQRLAMQRALDAWAAGHTPEARSAVLAAYTLPYAGELGTEPGGQSVAVNPAGTIVAVGHSGGTVRLWDVATREPLGEPLAGHGSAVYRTEFSPDGRLLATASIEVDEAGEANGVRVWEVPSGRLVRVLPGMAAVAWLPDGRGLAATTTQDGPADEPEVGVWDPRSGERLTTIPATGLVVDLAVSPDGAWLAGGRDDGTARVWRLSDGQPIADISGHQEGVRVAFSPSNQLATVGAEGEIRVRDLPGSESRSLTEGEEPRTVGRLTFTQDGYLLATGGGPPIAWWETTGGRVGGELVGYDGTPFDVATSADGRLVAATGTDSPTVLWRRATFWRPHPDAVMDVGFAPDGSQLAMVSDQGVVRVWDPATGAVTDLGRHEGAGYSVAYAPDGTLATTAEDGTVRVHPPDGGQPAVLTAAEPLQAQEVVFSPDSRLLAVAASASLLDDQPERVYLWDIVARQPPRILHLDGGRAGALAFTADGARLLVATHTSQDGSGEVPARSELRVWRTEGLVEEPAIALGEEQVIDITVSPDGQTLAITGASRNVQLATLQTDQRLLGLDPAGELGDHPANVRQVAFSPDGRTLATITADEPVIRFWDIGTGALLASLTSHDPANNGIAFSPDGRSLASAGPDGFVGLWVVDPDDAISRICEVISHALC